MFDTSSHLPYTVQCTMYKTASEHLQFIWHSLSVQADYPVEVSCISLVDDRNVTTKMHFHLALLSRFIGPRSLFLQSEKSCGIQFIRHVMELKVLRNYYQAFYTGIHVTT